MRDLGGLESALAKPQTGYYTDLIDEAAALWESLSQNHPFVDGNKRVSITVAAAFLAVNGIRLRFDDQEAYTYLPSLYESREFKKQRIEEWLRTRVIRF